MEALAGLAIVLLTVTVCAVIGALVWLAVQSVYHAIAALVLLYLFLALVFGIVNRMGGL